MFTIFRSGPAKCEKRGHHRWSHDPSGRSSYCIDCGDPHKSTAVDWDQPLEPGPVKMPTREELMADSRRAFWQVMPAEAIFPKPVIITRPIRAGNPEYGWLLQRLQPGESPFIHGLRATHWRDDCVGTP